MRPRYGATSPAVASMSSMRQSPGAVSRNAPGQRPLSPGDSSAAQEGNNSPPVKPEGGFFSGIRHNPGSMRMGARHPGHTAPVAPETHAKGGNSSRNNAFVQEMRTRRGGQAEPVRGGRGGR